MTQMAYPLGRPTPDRRQPDNVLAVAFPTLHFHVVHSMTLEGWWYIYVTTLDDKFVGNFWDPKEGFPSDVLIAKLALVA